MSILAVWLLINSKNSSLRLICFFIGLNLNFGCIIISVVNGQMISAISGKLLAKQTSVVDGLWLMLLYLRHTCWLQFNGVQAVDLVFKELLGFELITWLTWRCARAIIVFDLMCGTIWSFYSSNLASEFLRDYCGKAFLSSLTGVKAWGKL